MLDESDADEMSYWGERKHSCLCALWMRKRDIHSVVDELVDGKDHCPLLLHASWWRVISDR
jgi:hypothetical protein